VPKSSVAMDGEGGGGRWPEKKPLSLCALVEEGGTDGQGPIDNHGREGAGRCAELSARGRACGITGASAGRWGLAGSGRAGAGARVGERARGGPRARAGEEAGAGDGPEST
jgi:hypothetical protein